MAANGFTLKCPSIATEGTTLQCSLKNENATYVEWPVVAIIHSSQDDARALIEEDSVIPETDSRFSQDLKFASSQTAPMAKYNHGYGELFSGGSKSVYTIYGYQKFDWPWLPAAAGDERVVNIEIKSDQLSESNEVFYVALATSGYTGLSDLVDNKVPVLIQDPE